MAKRRGKKRGKHRARRSGGQFVARHNPPHTKRHRRRGHRRNPPGFMALVKTAPAFAGRALISGVGVVGGVIGARKVRGLFKQEPGSVMGSVIEIATGLVAGFGVSLIHPMLRPLGEAIAAGGVAAPVMTFVQNLKIPHISDSLGDDGYVIGDGTGLTLVSAHPDDYGEVVGDIPSRSSAYTGGGDSSVQGYATGSRRMATAAAAQAVNAA